MNDPLDRLFAQADAVEAALSPGSPASAWLAGFLESLYFAARYPGEVIALRDRLRAISAVGNTSEAIEAAKVAAEALADDLAAGLAGRGDALN